MPSERSPTPNDFKNPGYDPVEEVRRRLEEARSGGTNKPSESKDSQDRRDESQTPIGERVGTHPPSHHEGKIGETPQESDKRITSLVEAIQTLEKNGTSSLTKLTSRLQKLSIAIVLVCAALVILIVGQIYLLKRPGPRGPEGKQGLQGNKGDTGEKGDKGEPGISGTIQLVLQPDSARIGDIVLLPETGVVPKGFLRCDGAKIYRNQFPAYFEALGLEVDSVRVPKLSATGKVYYVKIQGSARS
jgi:hypothetical protein